MLEAEALELLSLGFYQHHVFELFCKRFGCGHYRITRLFDDPAERLPCPHCGVLRPITRFGLIYTRRSEPIVELLWVNRTSFFETHHEERQAPAAPDPAIVEALRSGASYAAVAQQFGISENSALAIRKRAGLPARQVHARL